MKVALCVGHSRYINGRQDGGAVASDGKTNEWTFNKKVAELAADRLIHHGINIKIIDYYYGSGYTVSVLWLARQLKEWNANIAIELHFNHYDGIDNDKGHGHEWLYWHTSSKGQRLAAFCKIAAEEVLPDVVSRGILPRRSGRGAVFLEQTHCPALIGEPFFGDDDFTKVTVEKVADVYVKAILNYKKFFGL